MKEAADTADQQAKSIDPATLSEVHGNRLLDLDQRLWDLFSATVSAHPDREAIVSLWQPAGHDQSHAEAGPTAGSECLRWSYRSLRARAERLAAALEKLGCGPGMHLAAVLWNCAEWALLFWAATRVGMTFVPIDPRASDEDLRLLLLLLLRATTSPRVLVVQDAEAAAAVDEAELGGFPLRIHCSGGPVDGWIGLPGLLLSPSARTWHHHHTRVTPGGGTDDGDEGGPPRASGSHGDAPALIVFTSGTTGSPKGCPHTNANLVSQMNDYDPNADGSLVDRWLVHTPVCHIFAINNALRAWRFGGTVVFAAKSFNVGSTLDALVREQCTVMSATPTLVKALLSHSAFPSPQDLSLSVITIAGTMIGPEHIRLCREGLGARDAIQAYGMSEGAPLISWSRQDRMLVDGYHPGVGKVLPGAALRICRPGSREIVSRAQVGELHISGPSVISSYLGNNTEGEDSFYADASGRWLKTGDQAMIDEKGVVHILGRYKDLIIRGGENINPLKIESALADISGLQVQVVGVPDDIAGQVPVAVVKLPEGISKAQVAEKARTLGPQYVLDAIYTLEELGLENIPVTSIGKPKKALLATFVVKLRSDNEAVKAEDKTGNDETATASAIEEALLGVWDQLTGVRPARTDSVFHLADSITLLRYCDAVLRVCGWQIYLQDFSHCDTVEKQARLLSTRDKQPGVSAGALTNGYHYQLQGVHAQGYAQGRFLPLEKQERGMGTEEEKHDLWGAAQERIVRLGLDGCGVEDIIPIRNSFHRMVTGQRPQSYHVRVVFRVRNVNGQQIFQGLSRALASRPMMRTVLCHTSQNQPYHAVVVPSEQLFARLICEAEAPSQEEAKERYQDGSLYSHSSAFMFGAVIIRVKDTGEYMLSLTYNHSVVDALTLLPWHRDLDRLIHDPNSILPTQTPYHLFADLFHQLQDSLPAQKSVSFHVQRLRGISRCKRALWPKQRAPGMMISNDEGSPQAAERRASRDQVWKGAWQARTPEFLFPRRSRIVGLPGLSQLRDSHGVGPALFAKCALAIFNALQTRSQFALFSSWESARSWPFVPAWVEAALPPAMSIDGPTVQWILNMFEVVDDEPVAGFFRRMLREQEQLRRHEHAPWDKVVQGLREEGDMAIDASFRQSFVWDVSMGLAASRASRSDFETLQAESRIDWADCGLFWNAFMVDADNLFFIASWDTAQMNVDEVDEHCDNLAAVMRSLADGKNWDRPVGEVFQRWRMKE